MLPIHLSYKIAKKFSILFETADQNEVIHIIITTPFIIILLL